MNRKYKYIFLAFVLLICIIICYTSCETKVIDNRTLKLIGGTNIKLKGEDSYELDLDSFSQVGETKECIFVFKNENSLYANTNVTATCNENYFKLQYEPVFSVSPSAQSEWKLAITLVKFPEDPDNFPFNINFHTTYETTPNTKNNQPSYNISFNVN